MIYLQEDVEVASHPFHSFGDGAFRIEVLVVEDLEKARPLEI